MTKQEKLNRRVRELIEQGYPGPKASDKARAEMKNPPKKRRAKRKKKNPLLASVAWPAALANPGKKLKKKKNFDFPGKSKATRGGKIKVLARKVPIEEIRNHPDYKHVLKSDATFHGAKATHVDVYEIPDGLDITQLAFAIGKAPKIQYIVEGRESNKVGYIWDHDTAKHHEMILVYNPKTKLMMYLPNPNGNPGTRVSDWLREYNE